METRNRHRKSRPAACEANGSARPACPVTGICISYISYIAAACRVLSGKSGVRESGRQAGGAQGSTRRYEYEEDGRAVGTQAPQFDFAALRVRATPPARAQHLFAGAGCRVRSSGYIQKQRASETPTRHGRRRLVSAGVIGHLRTCVARRDVCWAQSPSTGRTAYAIGHEHRQRRRRGRI